MKIYTRAGDNGQTHTLCAGRVPKYDTRVEALGAIDELSSWISYICAINEDEGVDEKLAWLQPKLNILCSDVATPIEKIQRRGKIFRVQPGWDGELEAEIDRMQSDLPVLKGFIKTKCSKCSPTGAALNLARVVCRRAERWLVLLGEEEGGVNPEAVRFINRLSDYLFTLECWATYRYGKMKPP
ncbi:MAG: cob(I)yrinic acid a,c-diamide adenosyltransferase [Deltaproteobacteria bacterium]|nr:cob(I)yrinic acid a,c-diamide adenosyltransferase [Deltaproteobacteria bacterium]MBW2199379.1 cob(I)yrinic acid a,c-diamide adenosyltransferase [Deltaproteobacteria bacterium]MBW2538152.1 cob(I)yrinic acid a,c-diamide adenosyltransferase [Deltaproteobacteria bacterium]